MLFVKFGSKLNAVRQHSNENRLMAIHQQIRPLFMSGYTANVIAHHGVLDKGLQFIEKPFSKKNLSMKIREVPNQNRH